MTQNATVDVDNSSCSTLVVLFGKENSFQLTFNQTTDNTSFFLAEVDVTLNGGSYADIKIKSGLGFQILKLRLTQSPPGINLRT